LGGVGCGPADSAGAAARAAVGNGCAEAAAGGDGCVAAGGRKDKIAGDALADAAFQIAGGTGTLDGIGGVHARTSGGALTSVAVLDGRGSTSSSRRAAASCVGIEGIAAGTCRSTNAAHAADGANRSTKGLELATALIAVGRIDTSALRVAGTSLAGPDTNRGAILRGGAAALITVELVFAGTC